MKRLNDYNSLFEKYQETSTKPDKWFSTLPTVLNLAGRINDKIVLDLGCGGGFFTTKLANLGAKKVIGIDNSKEQIKIARKKIPKNIFYKLGDVFKNKLPNADIIIAPYIFNYAKSVDQLRVLFKKIFKSLNKNGRLIAVIDLPEEGKGLKKYGAVKNILGEKKDGARIKINLFKQEQFICTLSAIYFTPQTVERSLKNAGFVNIQWHEPIISAEGIKRLGKIFWKGYRESSELGYISARKLKKAVGYKSDLETKEGI